MIACTELWLIRHAPVAGPRGVIHRSEAPADLRDSDCIAGISRSLPGDARAYCSPAMRTRQTAAALALDCRIVPALREQNFGDWHGRRHAEIASTMGDEYRRFWASSASNTPPGGESFIEQIARTRAAVGDIRDERAVLVVHSGTIRAILAVALDLVPERALSFVIDPLSVTRVDRTGTEWRIHSVNSRR